MKRFLLILGFLFLVWTLITVVFGLAAEAADAQPLPSIPFSTAPYTHNMTIGGCKYSGNFCVHVQMWGAYAVNAVSGGFSMVSPITDKGPGFQPAALTRCGGDFHQSAESVAASIGTPKWVVTTISSLGSYSGCTPVLNPYKVQVYALDSAAGLQYSGQAFVDSFGGDNLIIGDTAYIDTGDGKWTPVDLPTCTPAGCTLGAPVAVLPPHPPAQNSIGGYTYHVTVQDSKHFTLLRDDVILPTQPPVIQPSALPTGSPAPETPTKTRTPCSGIIRDNFGNCYFCDGTPTTCPGVPTSTRTLPIAATRTPTRPPTPPPPSPTVVASGCGPADPKALCLGNRFRVTATWKKPDGTTGPAFAAACQSADSGGLWFFAASNLELTVKALDGCGVNGKRWVFAAGMTNVGVTLTVEDKKNGATKTYSNAVGTPFAPIQDTSAFTCP